MRKIKKISLIIILICAILSCDENDQSKDKNISKNEFESNINTNRLEGFLVLKEDYEFGKIDFLNEDNTLWKSIILNDSFKDKQIKPYALKAENLLLVFRCVNIESSYFSIIVDENTKLVKKVKLTNFKFEKPENHILNVFSVDFDQKENPVYRIKKDKNSIIYLKKGSFFYPKKIENDWLKIEDEAGNSGWIKWKNEEGELLIYLYHEA